MNRQTVRKHRALFSLFATLALPATLLTGALMPKPAHALVPCTPPLCASEYTQLLNNYQLITGYYKQIEQYKKQIEQYKQQFIRGKIFRQTALKTADFKKRTLDEGVADRCPDDLKSMLSASTASDKCILLVRTENARYNAVVDILNKAKERDKELADIYEERAKIPEANTGELLANTNRLEAFLGRVNSDMQSARTQTESYDMMIGILKQEQAIAAKQTLDGGGLAGGAIRGIALHEALKSARRSDR
jgi:hypothetical protein